MVVVIIRNLGNVDEILCSRNMPNVDEKLFPGDHSI